MRSLVYRPNKKSQTASGFLSICAAPLGFLILIWRFCQLKYFKTDDISSFARQQNVAPLSLKTRRVWECWRRRRIANESEKKPGGRRRIQDSFQSNFIAAVWRHTGIVSVCHLDGFWDDFLFFFLLSSWSVRLFFNLHLFSRGEFNWNTRCALTAERWRKGFKIRYYRGGWEPGPVPARRSARIGLRGDINSTCSSRAFQIDGLSPIKHICVTDVSRL